MLSGIVNHNREALVRLSVLGKRGQQVELEAVVDTGYNGSLTLPSSVIAELNLPFHKRGRAILADGSEVLFKVYLGTVLWDGKSREITIDAADADPLLGMDLLHGHQLWIEVVEGGEVIIRPLSLS